MEPETQIIQPAGVFLLTAGPFSLPLLTGTWQILTPTSVVRGEGSGLEGSKLQWHINVRTSCLNEMFSDVYKCSLYVFYDEGHKPKRVGHLTSRHATYCYFQEKLAYSEIPVSVVLYMF